MRDVQQCRDLSEVRQHIDRIDREIVATLAERGYYVHQAAGFKRNEQEVKAPQRVKQVIERVRTMAEEQQGDPGVVEQVYRAMIAAFIEAEMHTHRNNHG
ncbi:chorismate mutase [Kushneria marisflavi]|uniref:chorismate mutase n=1 Tax=Kushneria marisflavi TaxID=157779 RepID=A0A240URW9_9GAMM|nr:chorismate mutase [Kushneria marisflavi]ART63823.1 chorismate mutase [Kushneria marisflavi]RKD85527.1 isochorismate pyruvate lyase [Kushneria marisflavi]